MTRGRTVALFPGAFQPPHAAHLAAVRHLVERPDVDETVVIISRRSRALPGTVLAIEPELSRRIWAIYLRDLPRVRVEIAPGTAIDRAWQRVREAPADERLLLCLGEQDFARGDDRFARCAESVECVVAPTGGYGIRSTALRRSLAVGEHEAFCAGLPETLSAAERDTVWQLCQDGLQPVGQLALCRLRPLIEAAALGEVAALDCIDLARPDPAYRLRFADGRRCVVRYAGDAEGDGGAARDVAIKPRSALKVERRALRRLPTGAASAVWVPTVRHFAREDGVLILDEVLPDGTTLHDAIAAGAAVTEPMARIGAFLAACHAMLPKPLRLDAGADRAHWEGRLAARIGAGDEAAPALLQLLAQCHAAARPALMWLNAGASSVRIDGTRVGAVDFEHAAATGDPAFDLGTFCGSSLLVGCARGRPLPVVAGVAAAFEAYSRASDGGDPAMLSRALAVAAAVILADAGDSADTAPARRVARLLLADGLAGRADVSGCLHDALEAI